MHVSFDRDTIHSSPVYTKEECIYWTANLSQDKKYELIRSVADNKKIEEITLEKKDKTVMGHGGVQSSEGESERNKRQLLQS